jgi:hypothetical protein
MITMTCQHIMIFYHNNMTFHEEISWYVNGKKGSISHPSSLMVYILVKIQSNEVSAWDYTSVQFVIRYMLFSDEKPISQTPFGVLHFNYHQIIRRKKIYYVSISLYIPFLDWFVSVNKYAYIGECWQGTRTYTSLPLEFRIAPHLNISCFHYANLRPILNKFKRRKTSNYDILYLQNSTSRQMEGNQVN